jgi:hypothetical protein
MMPSAFSSGQKQGYSSLRHRNYTDSGTHSTFRPTSTPRDYSSSAKAARPHKFTSQLYSLVSVTASVV